MAPKKPSRAIKLFGTEASDGKRRELAAGPITAMFDNGALRYIRYRGVEVLARHRLSAARQELGHLWAGHRKPEDQAGQDRLFHQL